MPMYDALCPTCGWSKEDLYVAVRGTVVQCPNGHDAEFVWTKAPAVIPDTYSTPVYDEHMTKTPQTFYSRSEHERARKAAGVERRVRHVGLPGHDRSSLTTRWI